MKFGLWILFATVPGQQFSEFRFNCNQDNLEIGCAAACERSCGVFKAGPLSKQNIERCLSQINPGCHFVVHQPQGHEVALIQSVTNLPPKATGGVTSLTFSRASLSGERLLEDLQMLEFVLPLYGIDDDFEPSPVLKFDIYLTPNAAFGSIISVCELYEDEITNSEPTLLEIVPRLFRPKDNTLGQNPLSILADNDIPPFINLTINGRDLLLQLVQQNINIFDWPRFCINLVWKDNQVKEYNLLPGQPIVQKFLYTPYRIK